MPVIAWRHTGTSGVYPVLAASIGLDLEDYAVRGHWWRRGRTVSRVGEPPARHAGAAVSGRAALGCGGDSGAA